MRIIENFFKYLLKDALTNYDSQDIIFRIEPSGSESSFEASYSTSRQLSFIQQANDTSYLWMWSISVVTL